MPADQTRLWAHVAALEGPRHPRAAPLALARAAGYVASELDGVGLKVEQPSFQFHGNEHRNLVATLPGSDPGRPHLLVGAHYDTVPGTPGADDNASGIAVLLEAARLLAAQRPGTTIEFAAFTLEEPQGTAYAVGSRAFVREARAAGKLYAGALILEMVGYTDQRAGSQVVPATLFWKRVPRTGTFLAATGDGQSARLLERFVSLARAGVSGLDIIGFRSPFRGWLVPQTRLSDNCRFWDAGYPALMLTDTAFLRNPHYHRAGDRLETLDFGFMARVTDAVVAAALGLATTP